MNSLISKTDPIIKHQLDFFINSAHNGEKKFILMFFV